MPLIAMNREIGSLGKDVALGLEQALGPQADMELKDLGELSLRGRKEPIRASGVKLR